MSRNQRIGRWGEGIAANYFAKSGFDIIGRNVRTPYGEIDLIVQQDGLTIFVEVKTRTTDLFGPPEVAINARKQEHLRAAVEHFMQEHVELESDWRVDALSVEGQPGQDPIITHFENVL